CHTSGPRRFGIPKSSRQRCTLALNGFPRGFGGKTTRFEGWRRRMQRTAASLSLQATTRERTFATSRQTLRSMLCNTRQRAPRCLCP
ncbi:hypothetical protein GGI22_007083, partial [Coemansia erecta]